jgi:hypothetical protein
VNRLFKSALFPILVVILLVYLGQSFILSHHSSTKPVTWSDFTHQVQTDPKAFDQIKVNQSDLKLTYTLESDPNKSYTVG